MRDCEIIRHDNLEKLRTLYEKLNIQNVERFDDLFNFKAINLSGVSLKKEEFGEVVSGKKYMQIVAVDKKEGEKSKSVSLKYYGKAEEVDPRIVGDVVEFVVRYRFEKSFINLEGHYELIENIN